MDPATQFNGPTGRWRGNYRKMIIIKAIFGLFCTRIVSMVCHKYMGYYVPYYKLRQVSGPKTIGQCMDKRLEAVWQTPELR